MTTTINTTMTAAQKEDILKRLGAVRNKRIAMDCVTGDFGRLAIALFKLGANIVVADRDKTQVQALNRILFEMSDSANRYRTVPIGNIMFEPVDIFIAIEPDSKVPPHAAFKSRLPWIHSEVSGAAAQHTSTQGTVTGAAKQVEVATRTLATANSA